MLYGVLADIHGNLPALRIAVKRLQDAGVEWFLCAGDFVGYGPFPNECVELVAGLRATAVHGNHDLIALGRLSDERCIPLARASLKWTRRRLGAESRAWLEGLPARVELDGVVMAHGSLDDPQRYIRDAESAAQQLAQLRVEHPSARVLLLGHTHVARAWGTRGERLTVERGSTLQLNGGVPALINPGAVGQSREPQARARSLILDKTGGTATFYADSYDLRSYRRMLRRAGLSTESAHLSPTFTGRVGRSLRRLEGKVYGRGRARSAEDEQTVRPRG